MRSLDERPVQKALQLHRRGIWSIFQQFDLILKTGNSWQHCMATVGNSRIRMSDGKTKGHPREEEENEITG